VLAVGKGCPALQEIHLRAILFRRIVLIANEAPKVIFFDFYLIFKIGTSISMVITLPKQITESKLLFATHTSDL